MLSPKASRIALVLLALIMAVAAALMPRIAQPLSYHHFADSRELWGIVNFADVISNLPFAIIGVWGLLRLTRGSAIGFHEPRERWPYLCLFAGLLLTAFGSTWYHLAPSNATLLWDRLPLNLVFMAMVAAIIVERIDVRLGLRLLPVLLAVGLAGVLQWYWSEVQGAGDMRFCAAVQIFAALTLPLSLLFPKRYTKTADFAVIFGFYVAAKALEVFDVPIFAALHIMSGHTLKHLAAAAAGACILRMLLKRRLLPGRAAILTAAKLN